MRHQVKKQLPRLFALVADKKHWGKEVVLRCLKNNTRRKEIIMGSLSRKDRFEAQRIINHFHA